MPAPPTLNEAIAAYQAGDRDAAERIASAILAANPQEAGAHYVRGLVAADRNALGDARAAFETAVSLAPDKPSLRITLGSHALRQGDDMAAERAFRAALEIAPGAVAAHTNLGVALKRQGRLDEAVAAFRAGLALYRGSAWWGTDPATGTAMIDPAQQATFQTASRTKLAHDLEQLCHLAATGRLDASLDGERNHYRSVLDRFGSEQEPDIPRPLSPAELRQIGGSFNRVVHLPPTGALSHALNPAVDLAIIERTYVDAAPPVVVVDNLLTDEALAALQRFCLEATIWFDCKKHGGYLGAYLHEGFDHPVLVALAKDLASGLPGIIEGHPLAQMWAFKYGQSGGGTRMHADKAAVNVNFWITPDDACLDPDAAGLTVYDVAAPSDWHFEDYNYDPAALERHVAQHAKNPLRVPYRCNRAVIFDSSLIHESGSVRFRDGYANRRINVTMLFGERDERYR